MVDPLTGIRAGFGVRAHPKLTKELPEIMAPGAGVSIGPKGFEPFPLKTLMVRKTTGSCFSESRMTTESWYAEVPLPELALFVGGGVAGSLHVESVSSASPSGN